MPFPQKEWQKRVESARYVVFDIDGTLIHSNFVVRILKKIFSYLCYWFSFSQDFIEYAPSDHWFRKISTKAVVGLDLFFSAQPGAEKLLLYLSRQKVKILCSTNAPYGGKRKLQKMGLWKFFDDYLDAHEVPKSKHISLFRKRLGLSKKQFSENTIYIGNNLLDAMISKDKNIFFVGLTSTLSEKVLWKVGANMVIYSLEQLLPLEHIAQG